jgi:hypothetical protein
VRYAGVIAILTGNPAVSVPLSWNNKGLPIGVHFLGRFGDEATLIRLAVSARMIDDGDELDPVIAAALSQPPNLDRVISWRTGIDVFS